MERKRVGTQTSGWGFDLRDVGPSGPVVTYKLTPEELAELEARLPRQRQEKRPVMHGMPRTPREEGTGVPKLPETEILDVLRSNPDMPAADVADALRVPRGSLWAVCKEHGGLVELRERARALGPADAAASPEPPAPLAIGPGQGEPTAQEPQPEPPARVDDPAPGVDAPGGSVDDWPQQEAAPPAEPAPAIAPAAAEQPDPGEAPADTPNTGSTARTEPDPGWRAVAEVALFPVAAYEHRHSIDGRIPLGELRGWVSDLAILIGSEAEVAVHLAASPDQTLAPAPQFRLLRWFGTGRPRPRGWQQTHMAAGRMPVHQLEQLLSGLAGILGPDAEVDASVYAAREVAI